MDKDEELTYEIEFCPKEKGLREFAAVPALSADKNGEIPRFAVFPAYFICGKETYSMKNIFAFT